MGGELSNRLGRRPAQIIAKPDRTDLPRTLDFYFTGAGVEYSIVRDYASKSLLCHQIIPVIFPMLPKGGGGPGAHIR